MTRDLLTAADLAEPTAPRFIASPEFTLPLGDVHAHEPGQIATGLGLLGQGSPLPLALADALAAHPSDLLGDLHHQRITTLLAGLRAADLARNLDGAAPWPSRIAALTALAHLSPGPGSPSQSDLSPGPDSTYPRPDHDLSLQPDSTYPDPLIALRLAPIFASPDRTPRSLALAIHRLLGRTGPAPALRCEPLPDRLTPLDSTRRTRLGTATANLADTAALGAAIRLPGAAARIHLGPIPTDALPRIRALVAAFLPEPLALEFVVDRPSTPPILGRYRLGHA